MGRSKGHKRQRELAEEELGYGKKTREQMMGERAGFRGQLIPSIQELGASGYSEAEKGKILGSAMEAGEEAYGTGQEQIRRQAARTRQTTGVAANIAELTRERARQKADIARGTEKEFADEATRRKMASLQMLGQMYGIDTELLSRLAQIPIQALQARAYGIKKGGFKLGPIAWN